MCMLPAVEVVLEVEAAGLAVVEVVVGAAAVESAVEQCSALQGCNMLVELYSSLCKKI